MKKSFKILSAAILTTTMAFGLGATILASNNEIRKTEAYYTPSTHYSVSDTASELASYYSTVSSTATGDTLLGQLQSLNSTKRKKTVGYSGMGTDTSGAFIYTDYDLNNTTTDSNGQKYGTKVASFYTKTSATSWNREHTWPKSHGGNTIEADILMTRPTITQENSDRGNSFYVEGKSSQSAGWDPYTAGYAEWCRGECARIILYGCVANSSLSLSDADSHSTSNSNPDNLMGNINTLIKWHFAYTPNEYEMNRNNGAEYLQGNRNPFVDHPEYVAKIWSSYNSTVSNLCTSNSTVYSNWTVGSCSTYGTNNASGGSTNTDPAISITASANSVKVGNTITLTALKTNLTGTVQWYVSDSTSNVVSLSASSGDSITVTGVSEGTKTIYAHIGTVSAHVDITVTSASSNQGGLVTSNSDLSTGDKVVVRTQQATPNGVTGFNNSKDATISTTESAWKQFTVKDASSSGFKLYDDAAQKYIASPGGNEFKYSTSGGVCSVDSDGHLICNSRYLVINGTYNRFYTSIGSYTPFYVYSVGSSTPKTLSSIAVKTAPTKTTYTAGENFNPAGLVIRATYSDSSVDDITYSSSNSSSFTFNPSTSTALTVSNTSVTISYGGKSCSQAITVNAASTPTVNSVTVSPATLSLNLNGTNTGTLTATVSVSGGAAQTVNWSSSNSNIASVNSSGVVTGVAAGTATITATSTVDSSKKGTCTVTVTSGSSTQPQHAGTEADPYTTADAKLVMDNTGSGVVYQTEVYVSMVPTSSSFNSSYNQYTCTDSNMEISSASLAFTPKGTYTEANALVGKTVVAKGYIELYQGVYKMGYLPASVSPTGSKYNPTIVSITPDTSSGEQSEGVYTLAPAAGSNSSYAGSGDVTINNVSWSVNGNNTMVPWRLGGKSITNTDRTVTSTVAVSSENISSVVLTVGNASDITVNSLTLKVGTSQGANDVSSITATFEANSDITFERPSGKDWSNCYFTFVFNVTVSINSNKFVQFTKAVFYANNSTSGAATYAATFLSAFTCNAQGTSAPTFTTSWAQLKTAFNALDTADQNTLRNATANENGTDIEKAMARYDYVVAKYGYENFISRTSGSSANKMNTFNGTSANNLLLVLGSISLLGGLTYLAYFLKKRKED